MKTIICGPPHSGKSVLINNLHRLMPSEDYLPIRANGDGEGYWTNNPNQHDVDIVRKRNKSGNTEADFKIWRQRIINAHQTIVLVDIGGRLSDDKAQLFDVCDSFIVISSNPEIKHKWIEFGTAHGCRCLAAIDSVLDDYDEIIDTKPYLQARIGKLERGFDVKSKKVTRELADMIIRESGYKEIINVNFYDIAENFLHCANQWTASNGVKVRNIYFTWNTAPQLYDYLVNNCPFDAHYRLIGADSNMSAAIAAEAISDGNIENISFFDRWTGRFIQPHKLNKVANPQNKDINIEVKENDKAVLLDFTMKEALDIDVEHFAEYQLPAINEGKILLVSGRFPNWFTDSVLKSYNNKEKYFRIPGLNYFCVASEDYHNLGKVFI